MGMKKLLTSVGVLVMVIVLGACGKDQLAEDADGRGGVETEQREKEESDEGNGLGKEDVISGDKTVTDVKESKEENGEKEKENESAGNISFFSTIEETVLWDEKGVKITAMDLTYSEDDAEVSLLIENDNDKDVSIIAGSAGYCCNVVNRYMVEDGYLNVDVSAGKKAKEKIEFSLKELQIYGIKEIAEIQIGFDIEIGEEEFYTGPRVVKTSIANNYDYTCNTFRKNVRSGRMERDYECTIEMSKDREMVVMDGLTIQSYTLVRNSDEERILLLEIKNDTVETIRFETVGLSVNDLSVYRYSLESDFIAPNCYCVMGIELNSCIEEAYWRLFGLKSLDNIGFTVKVRDESYWEVLAEQKFCLECSDTVTPVDTSGTEVFNKEGIRVIFKEMFEDTSEYSDDIHLVFLVENNYSEMVRLENIYDSLSVNGFMTDYSLYGGELEQGERIVLDVEIDADSLVGNGVAEMEDILDVEFSIGFETDRYDEIAKTTLKLKFIGE